MKKMMTAAFENMSRSRSKDLVVVEIVEIVFRSGRVARRFTFFCLPAVVEKNGFEIRPEGICCLT